MLNDSQTRLVICAHLRLFQRANTVPLWAIAAHVQWLTMAKQQTDITTLDHNLASHISNFISSHLIFNPNCQSYLKSETLGNEEGLSISETESAEWPNPWVSHASVSHSAHLLPDSLLTCPTHPMDTGLRYGEFTDGKQSMVT